MANFGTSGTKNIEILNMNPMSYHKTIDFDLSKTHPPVLKKIKDGKATTENISAIQKWITPWPEISFEKINFPKYEGIYQYLGEPSNIPDFIKDYHLISIARNIDYWAEPVAEFKIKCTVNSVKSK